MGSTSNFHNIKRNDHDNQSNKNTNKETHHFVLK